MTHTLYTSSYRDINNKRILWDDSVLYCKFYTTENEVWDRTGGGTASWYTETGFPNDTFDYDIDPQKWSVTSSSSGFSISSSNNKATFTLGGGSGSLYISSAGLWSLSGDFRIRLGIVISDYYDEYRASTSFGLNVSIGTLYNVRVAVVRNQGSTGIRYQALYTDNEDVKFFGWAPLSSEVVLYENIRFFEIRRTGTLIECFVNEHLIGYVSGSGWSGNASVSVGAESSQINKYVMSASYFSILSGQMSTPKMFSSEYSGPNGAFPETSYILVDSGGLSVVDASNLSLWRRFSTGSLVGPGSKVEALNGRLYCSSSAGLYIVDFPSDRIYKYSQGLLLESDVGLALRNSSISYKTTSSGLPLTSDNITGICAKNISGKEFLVATTASGISVIIDRASVKNCGDGHIPAKTAYLSDNNNLYWSNYNSNNEGDLSYYNNVANLATMSGTSFSRQGYFDSTTPSRCLISENISSIHTCGLLGRENISIGTAGGAQVILSDPLNGRMIKSYGVVRVENPISDPIFSLPIGISPWIYVSSCSYPVSSVSISTSWYTGDATSSLRFRPGIGGVPRIKRGQWTGVEQRIDITSIDKVYYDIRLTGPAYDAMWGASYKLQILLGGIVLKEYEEVGNHIDTILLDEFIDVGQYTGFKTLSIVVTPIDDDIIFSDTKYFYISNIRTDVSYADYPILGGRDPSVMEVFLSTSSSANKLMYATTDGYGSIDLDSDSSDYFVPGTDIVVSGVDVNYAEFIRYDI